MPISVECPACGSTFRVRDDHAGKRGRCSKCKATLLIPDAPA
ncbi:zinc-ribbon domain-containing protein, partial [Singulisphaera rosea]